MKIHYINLLAAFRQQNTVFIRHEIPLAKSKRYTFGLLRFNGPFWSPENRSGPDKTDHAVMRIKWNSFTVISFLHSLGKTFRHDGTKAFHDDLFIFGQVHNHLVNSFLSSHKGQNSDTNYLL